MILSTTSKGDSVRYFVVQYTADVFRRETRNVGVVVQRGADIQGRFFGERSDGELDGRSIRSFRDPDVYREWVKYWRRVLQGDAQNLEKNLMRPNGQQFNVLDAGYIEGASGDALQDVCQYAYSMLVSTGGLVEALGASVDEEQALENLRNDILSEFRRHQIIGRASLFTPQPIYTNQHFLGATSRTHTVSFAQRRGPVWSVMEPVNFSTTQKNSARDRAGFAAYVFEDVAAALGSNVEPISIVRYNEEDWSLAVVQYSLGLLQDRSHVVRWDNPRERSEFLNERVAIAQGHR